MKLLRTFAGNHRAVVRALGHRNFSAPSEEYLKRNYASTEAEYNTVIGSITAQRRNYLLRDVYGDMMLDGVKPERDTFHSLVVGTMKGGRMQDALYFHDEMKSMDLSPDVALYNYLISTCGKCKNSDQAIRLLEEMRRSEVKPTGQTYICLLHACAASGRLDRVNAIVRDMTAAALGLNKFCYAGLIIAQRNKSPLSDDTASEIIGLVEKSKGWYSVDQTKDMAENVMMGISEEELYNLPIAEYVHRRGGFIDRQLTVYHVAFHACADLRDVQVYMCNNDEDPAEHPDPNPLIDPPTDDDYYGGDEAGESEDEEDEDEGDDEVDEEDEEVGEADQEFLEIEQEDEHNFADDEHDDDDNDDDDGGEHPLPPMPFSAPAA